jgi:hypothetical protein
MADYLTQLAAARPDLADTAQSMKNSFDAKCVRRARSARSARSDAASPLFRLWHQLSQQLMAAVKGGAFKDLPSLRYAPSSPALLAVRLALGVKSAPAERFTTTLSPSLSGAFARWSWCCSRKPWPRGTRRSSVSCGARLTHGTCGWHAALVSLRAPPLTFPARAHRVQGGAGLPREDREGRREDTRGRACVPPARRARGRKQRRVRVGQEEPRREQEDARSALGCHRPAGPR